MARKKSENIEESKRDIVSAIEVDNGTQNDISIALTAQEKMLEIGDKVKVKKGSAIYNTSEQFPNGFYANEYFITHIENDCVILSLEKHIGLGGSISGAVNIKDLENV